MFAIQYAHFLNLPTQTMMEVLLQSGGSTGGSRLVQWHTVRTIGFNIFFWIIYFLSENTFSLFFFFDLQIILASQIIFKSGISTTTLLYTQCCDNKWESFVVHSVVATRFFVVQQNFTTQKIFTVIGILLFLEIHPHYEKPTLAYTQSVDFFFLSSSFLSSIGFHCRAESLGHNFDG